MKIPVEGNASLLYSILMQKMDISFLHLIPLLLLVQIQVFAQDNQDPLWNYRTGRDLESRSRMGEAQNYYNEAIRISNNAISRNTANRDTYTALIWTLHRQRKYADVITWGERGLRLYADEYRIMETMGEAYFYLDNYDLSLRYLQRFTNSVPRGERTPVAYFFIGEIHRYRNQFLHADIAYSTAVRLEPNVALWWYRLGTVREAAGDHPQAVTAYGQALRITPYYPEASEGFARSRRFTQ